MSNRVKAITVSLFLLLALPMLVLIIYINSLSNDEDIQYLSEAIYHEARGEPISGMIAVGQVIKNRTASPNYPNTIKEVVKQPLQFSYRNKGQPEKPKNKAVYQFCKILSHGILKDQYKDYSNGAEFYMNESTATDRSWIEDVITVNEIGQHTFYRPKDKLDTKKLRHIRPKENEEEIIELLEEYEQ